MSLSYIKKPNTIKLSQFSKSRFSLCPKDYRELFLLNSRTQKLSDLLKGHFQGQEIGSEAYTKKSNYRFLKTVNITDSYSIDETSIEYCLPINRKHPEKNNILIVKDGAGNGLGEVCLYPYENKLKTDSISAGVLGISVKEEFLFYVLGILKSNHFKDFINLNTPEGSTIRHSKKIALEYFVPFHKDNNVTSLISLLVENVLDKEKEIKTRLQQINKIIELELEKNQNKNFTIPATSINLIKQNDLRFDAGMYSLSYKNLRGLIKNYNKGHFSIPFKDLKSGSTPDVRLFSSKGIFKWVTPTDIKDEGFFTPTDNISMPSSHNLDKDAILFINRTSKGKKGEYVGIACFYDHSYYGLGHHNQGIYRVEAFSSIDKQFIVAFMNSKIMRKICGLTSQGTKMKEMKMNNFSDLIFPNFPIEQKTKIAKAYYNTTEKIKSPTTDNYLINEKFRNKELGIFQLNIEIIELKNKLAKLIDKIIKEEKIEIEF